MAVLGTAIHASTKCSDSNVLDGATRMRGSSPRMTDESDTDLTHDAIDKQSAMGFMSLRPDQ
jgi:hypothetical protein